MRRLATRTVIMALVAVPAGVGAAEEHIVSQKQLQFMVNDAKAATVTVKPGDTVVFRNDDRTAHNVFSRTPGSEFDLGILRRGTSAKHTFDKSGSVAVECAIHQAMKLTVDVKP